MTRMNIDNSHRLAALSTLFFLLAGCGGGGSPVPPPGGAPSPAVPVTIDGQVVASFTAADGSTDQGQTASAFAYAEKAGDLPVAPTLSVAGNILNVTSSFNNTGGSTFGGVGIDIPLRDADRNQVQSGATSRSSPATPPTCRSA